MKSVLVALSFVAAWGGVAQAQYNISAAGPILSAGPSLAGPGGGAGNGMLLSVYAGTDRLFGSFKFTGDLTAVNPATWGEESQFEIGNLNLGWNFSIQAFPGLQEYAPNTLNADVALDLLLWINPGDTIEIEAFESFDDAGVDSQWNNVNFRFNPAVFGDLGSMAAGPIDLSTFGSTFDTELALYTIDGLLLGTNDDQDFDNDMLTSQLVGSIGPGDYYVVVGAFDSFFINGGAAAGGDSGEFVVSINGESLAGGALAAGQFQIYSLNVVPEPSTNVMLALGVVGLWARRRRK